ncbi:hypothetical protein O1L60_04385 [Streptomyces diastatochromogenes]|nr:hypothetical protein [Streptomyces diastatochromogenes]
MNPELWETYTNDRNTTSSAPVPHGVLVDVAIQPTDADERSPAAAPCPRHKVVRHRNAGREAAARPFARR